MAQANAPSGWCLTFCDEFSFGSVKVWKTAHRRPDRGSAGRAHHLGRHATPVASSCMNGETIGSAARSSADPCAVRALRVRTFFTPSRRRLRRRGPQLWAALARRPRCSQHRKAPRITDNQGASEFVRYRVMREAPCCGPRSGHAPGERTHSASRHPREPPGHRQ